MSVSEDFIAEMLNNSASVTETRADNWVKVYEELTRSGTSNLVLPSGVPETGLNIALGMIRTLQAKALAFDALCEDAPKFEIPDAADTNTRMYIAGAEEALGSIKDLQDIANNALQDNEFAWGEGNKRIYH